MSSMEMEEMSTTWPYYDYTNDTQVLDVDYPVRPDTYIMPVVLALIFVVGLLGNGTLVLIFIRHRDMRNVPNTYIFSLALGDLLAIVTCVPFASISYTLQSWPYGDLMCKLTECVKYTSLGVSAFTLTALSADSFFAIVDAKRKLHTEGSGRRSTNYTVVTAGAIWILAVLCALPAAIGSTIYVILLNDQETHRFCIGYTVKLGRDHAESKVILVLVIYYGIPLIIITFFYLLMARHLILGARNVSEEMQGQAGQVKANKNVAKMVLALVISFAVCFLPTYVYSLLFLKDEQKFAGIYNQFWLYFGIIGFCLSFAKSCINPIALYCVSGTFRKHFNKYLLCNCCKNCSSTDRQ